MTPRRRFQTDQSARGAKAGARSGQGRQAGPARRAGAGSRPRPRRIPARAGGRAGAGGGSAAPGPGKPAVGRREGAGAAPPTGARDRLGPRLAVGSPCRLEGDPRGLLSSCPDFGQPRGSPVRREDSCTFPPPTVWLHGGAASPSRPARPSPPLPSLPPCIQTPGGSRGRTNP